jgi:transposase InsO family protein
MLCPVESNKRTEVHEGAKSVYPKTMLIDNGSQFVSRDLDLCA